MSMHEVRVLIQVDESYPGDADEQSVCHSFRVNHGFDFTAKAVKEFKEHLLNKEVENDER